MNVRNSVLWFIILTIFAEQASGLFDPITGGIAAAIGGISSGFYYGYNYYKSKCEREECCEERWVIKNIGGKYLIINIEHGFNF